MKWLRRAACLSLVTMWAWSCAGSDVGNECKIDDVNTQSLIERLAGKPIRIVIGSFDCAFQYCFVTYYDPNKKDKGYCSRICKSVADCPKNYTCETIVEVQNLPSDNTSLLPLRGQSICMKPAPVPGS